MRTLKPWEAEQGKAGDRQECYYCESVLTLREDFKRTSHTVVGTCGAHTQEEMNAWRDAGEAEIKAREAVEK